MVKKQSSSQIGSIFGCAVIAPGNVPSKVCSPTVPKRQLSSYGVPPSHSERIRPACDTTLVFDQFLAVLRSRSA